jgi:hypothetical protein
MRYELLFSIRDRGRTQGRARKVGSAKYGFDNSAGGVAIPDNLNEGELIPGTAQEALESSQLARWKPSSTIGRTKQALAAIKS